MKVDIFIRTYEKDLEWLQYCLRSISKYVTGHRNVIICLPVGQKKLLDSWGLTKESIVEWFPVCKDGYIDQQINKLCAYEYTDADYILFVDSDVCFKRPVNVEEYFQDGKPIILKTDYSKVGDAICWKEVTENIINEKLQFEYMRRLPILYKRSTLVEMCNKYDYIGHISALDKLSEFNLAGAYAELFDNENYVFMDTEKDSFSPDSVIQKWSWGGLTPEIKSELEAVVS